MKKEYAYAQIFLRLALGIGFIYPVLDRIGWLGPADGNNIGWGDWPTFLNYTHILLPIFSKSISDTFGLIATIAEVVFAILLIVGYKTKLASIGSFILLFGFATCMAITLGLKAPFNYSVFTASAAALLLSCVNEYKWSLDNLKSKL